MLQKKGRPVKVDNRKNVMFRTRIDEDTAEKLKITAENLNITKSEVVRRGIEKIYKETKRR